VTIFSHSTFITWLHTHPNHFHPEDESHPLLKHWQQCSLPQDDITQNQDQQCCTKGRQLSRTIWINTGHKLPEVYAAFIQVDKISEQFESNTNAGIPQQVTVTNRMHINHKRTLCKYRRNHTDP
jgi:hypothetical protein